LELENIEAWIVIQLLMKVYLLVVKTKSFHYIGIRNVDKGKVGKFFLMYYKEARKEGKMRGNLEFFKNYSHQLVQI